MTTFERRLERLENRNGFNSQQERKEYLKYARLVDPDIRKDDIRNPDDYLNLLKSKLNPLPA